MKKLLTALVLLPLAGLTQAGDAAQFRPLGFSADGRYYAFAAVGVHDGSGFPFANLAVVEVAKNTLAATKTVELKTLGAGATPDKALGQAIAEVKLDRFGIKQTIAGQDLLVHLPTDLSTRSGTRFTFPAGDGYGPVNNPHPEYEIRVEATKGVAAPDAAYCTDIGGPQLLKLSIVGGDGTDGKARVLQQDERLPASRACPADYQVRRITAYKDGLVIALSYLAPGFEGPDLRYLVVTGKFAPPPP